MRHFATTVALIAACTVVFLGWTAAPALADNAAPGISADARREMGNRSVDELALSSKRKAIATLSTLAKNRANTAEEPLILMRLVETLHSAGAIEFRIAHGRAMVHPEALDLTAYRGYMRESILWLNRFVTKYPRDPQLPRAIYLRAKAFKEIDDRTHAVSDFKYLIDNYPQATETTLGNLSLCDLLIDNKDYNQAIMYLNKLASNTLDTAYPLAMDRLAWIYYYMNDVPRGISYLEREISFYRARKVVSMTDGIDREKAISNGALFYATGMERKLPGYEVGGAIPFFKRLGAVGAEFNHVAVHFAYLLRTKGFEIEIEQFAHSALALMPPAEATDLLAVVMDYEIQKRRYPELRQNCEQMFAYLTKVTNDDSDRLGRAKHLLQTGAAAVQTSFTQSIGRPDEGQLAQNLVAMYLLMLRHSGLDLAGQTRIRFNLAETAFQEKDYPMAVANYRWIVENGSKANPGEIKLADTAQLKAIGGRYEWLKKREVFPKELKPVALGAAPVKAITPEIVELVKWIDQAPPNHEKEIEGFSFESNRLYYALGHQTEAMDRMAKFIKTHPKSQYTTPSASLIIDTYIATGDWDKTRDVAVELMNSGVWKGQDFERKLYTIAGDADFKSLEIAYQKQDFSGALKRVDYFLKNYKTNSHHNEALAIAANSSLGLKDKKGALAFFGELNRNGALKDDLVGTALLTSGSVGEEQYNFSAAAKDYWGYLNLPKNERNLSDPETLALKKKTLMLAWMSGNPSQLEQALSSPKICSEGIAAKCQEIQALSNLDPKIRRLRHIPPFKYISTVFKQRGVSRLVYAAIALDELQPLSNDDTYKLLRLVADEWDQQDPEAIYHLLPHFSKSIPEALQHARKTVKAEVRLRVDKKVIAKRVKLIEEMEAETAPLGKLPWARVKVALLNEVANLYDDFAQEIEAMPAPDGIGGDDLKAYQATLAQIASPYEKKRTEIRAKALEIAQAAPVDDRLLQALMSKYLIENPDFAKKSGHGIEAGLPDMINADLFTRAIGGIAKTDKDAAYKQSLLDSFKSQNWPRISVLLGEGKERAILSEAEYHVARAVSLALAGANAEAIPELFEARDHLSSTSFDPKISVLIPMICSYYNAYAMDKTRELVEEFNAANGYERKGTGITPAAAGILAKAAQWSNAKVASDFGDRLISLAQSEAASRLPADEGGSQ